MVQLNGSVAVGTAQEQVEDRPGEHPDARQQAPVEGRVSKPGGHGHGLLRPSIAHPFGEKISTQYIVRMHEDDEEDGPADEYARVSRGR